MRGQRPDRRSALSQDGIGFAGVGNLGPVRIQRAFQLLERQLELFDLEGELLRRLTERHPPELGKLEPQRRDERVAGRQGCLQLGDPGILVEDRGGCVRHGDPLADRMV